MRARGWEAGACLWRFALAAEVLALGQQQQRRVEVRLRLLLEYLHLVAQVGKDQDNLVEQLVVGLDEAVQRDGLVPRNCRKPDRARHFRRPVPQSRAARASTALLPY